MADQLRNDLMRLAVDHGIWQEFGTFRTSQFVNAVMARLDIAKVQHRWPDASPEVAAMIAAIWPEVLDEPSAGMA